MLRNNLTGHPLSDSRCCRHHITLHPVPSQTAENRCRCRPFSVASSKKNSHQAVSFSGVLCIFVLIIEIKFMNKRYVYMTVLCPWLAGTGLAQPSVCGTPEKASDFTYTLASGEQGTLYALRSEWILLYFYDPACEDCQVLMEQLNASEILNRLIDEKRIRVLAVYPEEDTAVWLEQAEHVPQTWINGYDKDAAIYTKGLYRMMSLPVLYLLDRDKNIRLQTATADEIENELKLISDKQKECMLWRRKFI
jgi:hypothetical protein